MNSLTASWRDAATRKVLIELLVLSLLSLFCELVIIRWLSTEIRAFAYFKNVPLLAVFLGLGLGFVWADKKVDFYKWSAIGLLFLSGLLTVAFSLGLTYLSFILSDQYMLWGLHASPETSQLVQTIRNMSILVAVFVLTASIFIGLGQRMGRLFQQLPPLTAYSVNVLGGLLGTLLLLALSFLYAPPGVWLIIAGALYFFLDRRPVSVALILFGIVYGAWLSPYLTQQAFRGDSVKTIWSPYYRIDVVRQKAPPPYQDVLLGYNVYINYDSFQSVVDCSPATVQKLPAAVQATLLDSFSEPFKLLSKPGQEVLVLGSGSGSDVAAALRANVGHVDAVEIDPAIADLGRSLHPEQPYKSEKVSLYVTDARNFLQNANKKYDVIVFAALDSHAAFSALSSLRMDNYVFTEEAFRQASQLLAPGGVMYVQFIVPGDWLWQRHAKAMAHASNTSTIGARVRSAMDSGTLIAGPGTSTIRSASGKYEEVGLDSTTETSTDDWPFLFLPRKEVPMLYLMPLLVLLAVSSVPVISQFRQGMASALNWVMFFLGMAFMLLEVRAMADLSLLFGSTWLVNSVIISAVMVVILLGNLLAPRLDKRFVPYLLFGVLSALVLSTFVSANFFISLGPAIGTAAGITMYLFPLVFAAVVFALLFKEAAKPNEALAFNLVGGAIGICLEYVSMWLGVRALGWVGAALYLTALVIYCLSKRSTSAAPVPEASGNS